MMLYKPNPKKLDNEFLLFAIYSEQVQKRLLELAGGSTVGHIRVGDIRDLAIAHPIDLEEQERVASVLRGIADELEQHSKVVQKLQRTKTALMQDLLTGEKRVTPLLEADDEQASGSAP
jgi:type I restriction enzyme, S subunit